MPTKLLSFFTVFAITAAVALGIIEIPSCTVTSKVLCAGIGAIAGATLGVVAIALIIIGSEDDRGQV
jgi:hypothetical protein